MPGTLEFIQYDFPLFLLDLFRDLVRDFTIDREFLLSQLSKYEKFGVQYLAQDNKMTFQHTINIDKVVY